MKVGKVSETILKRSIFKQIHTKREEVILGAGVGEDCAAVKLKPGEVFVLSTDPITGTVKDVGMLAIQITVNDLASRAGVGEDCAAVKLKPGEVFVLSTDPITGTVKDVGMLAIQITVNDLASSGAEPVGVLLTVLLPEETEESDIREMMGQVEEACARFRIQVMGGHTEVTKSVNQPVISVTGVGKVQEDSLVSTSGAKPGQDILVTKWIGVEGTSIIAKEKKEELLKRFPESFVETALVSTSGAKPGQDILVTKWIGVEGTSIIAKEKKEELLKRFPESFVETAAGFDQYLSVLPESRIAAEHGVSAMHDVTEGGIYGALWEVAEASGIGLEIDLKAIPVRQETIEICEYFELNPYYLISSGIYGALWEVAEASGIGLEIDLKAIPVRQETIEICEYFELNPYYLISSGCMLMAADRGHDLVQKLKEAGIPAVVIGKAVPGKARRIRNGGEESFLERPKTDELYKIYQPMGGQKS